MDKNCHMRKNGIYHQMKINHYTTNCSNIVLIIFHATHACQVGGGKHVICLLSKQKNQANANQVS